MGTSKEFAQFILEQCHVLEHVTTKKMFGEYGLFYHLKMVGVLADNKLYIKPTDEGKALLSDIILEPFYPGSKPYLLIEDIEDRELLIQLILTTYDALPETQIKQPRARKGKANE